MTQHRLVMRTGPTPGKVIDLTADSYTIGREPSNDIPINDAEISRKHARISVQGDNYTIEDLGSTNGTFVNGQRLMGPHLLKPGEIVSFGEQISCTYEAISSEADSNATIISSKPAPPPPTAPSPTPIAPPPSQPKPAAPPPPPPASPSQPRPAQMATPSQPKPVPPPSYAGQVPAGPTAAGPAKAAPPKSPAPSRGGGRGRIIGIVAVVLVLCVCCACTAFFYNVDRTASWCTTPVINSVLSIAGVCP